MSRPVTASTKVTDKLTGEEKTLTVSYTYDNMGNVITYSDAEGNETYYEYDLNCQLIKVTDSEGVVQVEYTYDSLGRVLSEKTSDGIISTYTYDISGNISTVTQTTGTGDTKTYTYTYDTMGRLLTVTDPTGVTTSQSYDQSGNLTELTYPQGGGISYGYDEYGRLVEERLSIGTTYTYEYNQESNVSAYTNGRGKKTTYTYDKAGRMTGFTDELGTVSYSYDECGNLTLVSETRADGTTSTIKRTYDCMNRVETYTDYNGKTVKYSYDELGNMVSLTYPGGEIVRYSYTDNGLLEAVVDGEGYKTSYTYDSSGRLLTTENPDGTVETNTYDGYGRLASTSLVAYGGDAEGSGEPSDTESVTEDGGTVLYTISYTYDQWGNITSISCQGELEDEHNLSTLTSATMTYDESNRMLTYNGEDILYDEDGNMTYGPLDGEMTTFQYDCRNRLIKAGDTSYEYDAEDVRIAVETPEYRDEYVTDTVTVLSRVLEVERTYKDVDNQNDDDQSTEIQATTRASGDTVKSIYYYGNGLIYEKNSDIGLLVYHYDHLGSTKAITDESGELIAEFSYGSYGELLTDKTEYSEEVPEIRFLYNGQMGVISDDNSLYYMRARYYNPQIKRFINQDILTGNIGNNKSLNRYSYVEGNPVSYTDPFGLSPLHFILDVAGIFFPAADFLNAAIFLLEGNVAEALKSIAYASPGLDICGAFSKLSKHAGKFGKYIDDAAELITYGGYAGAIAFGTYDAGTAAGNMIDKYLVNGEDFSAQTIWEVAMVVVSGAQAGGGLYYFNKAFNVPDTPSAPSTLNTPNTSNVQNTLNTSNTPNSPSTINAGASLSGNGKSNIEGGKYSNLDDGLNFSNRASEHMAESGRQVPVQTLQDAIRYGEPMPDPRGSNATMYYTTMYKNGKMYNLEVLYDEATNTVYHFEYARKAMGNLPAIQK